MSDVTITRIDAVMMRVEVPIPFIARFREFFAYKTPGAEWSPRVRGIDKVTGKKTTPTWDGYTRLWEATNGRIYAGLLPRVMKWCRRHDLSVALVGFEVPEPVSTSDIGAFYDGLDLPIEPRDFQWLAFRHALTNGRGVYLSATGSGKSLLQYMLARWMMTRDIRTLIIVPTVGLVEQMISDFTEYGAKPEMMHSIYAGARRFSKAPIIVSTWQSLHMQPPEYFYRFGCLIGDEVHGWKAKRLVALAKKASNAEYRFGLTGTLDEIPIHQLVLEGLFGPVKVVAKTAELIEKKVLTPVKVEILIFKWPDVMSQRVVDGSYAQEIDTIISSPVRNDMIARLVKSLKGNTLVLFNYIERHGDLLKEKLPDAHYIHGGVDVEDREAVREIMENSDDATVLATYGTFSTGINIKRLHNIVFASPIKGKVRLLQSIGRGVRKSADKSLVRIFDIVDDFRIGQDVNYAFEHHVIRRKQYESEGFAYVERRLSIGVGG